MLLGQREDIQRDLVPLGIQSLIRQCWQQPSSRRPTVQSLFDCLEWLEYMLPRNEENEQHLSDTFAQAFKKFVEKVEFKAARDYNNDEKKTGSVFEILSSWWKGSSF